MSKPTIARYTVTNGLQGCYMPDNCSGPMEFYTRKALADNIRYELEQLDFPASLFGDVRIRNLWAFIKRNGSSCAHFSLYHNGYALEFHGLTEEEFEQQSADQD